MSSSRLPVVGVMGSGSRAHRELAEPLGRRLARAGVHLLTGGGPGVMESVSRAFAEVPGRAGLVIGVLPAGEQPGREPTGYPNPWLELVIRTHLPHRGAAGGSVRSRNHINVLSSDLVVILPGGEGTASEAELALRYRRPVVAYLGAAPIPPWLPPQVPLLRHLDELAGALARLPQRVEEPEGY